MTERTFNLIDHGWIPIQGVNARQGLKQIFSQGDLKQLSGNSVEKIVVLRLLLAITHAAVSLPDNAAWLSLSLPELAEKVIAYLQTWHDHFDLYGKKPFMQFPQLAQGKTSPFSVAQLCVATGNKVILKFVEYIHPK